MRSANTGVRLLRKRTKVNRTTPRNALTAISRKIFLLRMDMNQRAAAVIGGGGTRGGFGKSSCARSRSISSNNMDGAITETGATKLAKSISANGAMLYM